MRLDHRGPFEAVDKEGGVHSITVAPLSRGTVAARPHAASPEDVWHTGRAKRLLGAAAQCAGMTRLRHKVQAELGAVKQTILDNMPA